MPDKLYTEEEVQARIDKALEDRKVLLTYRDQSIASMEREHNEMRQALRTLARYANEEETS